MSLFVYGGGREGAVMPTPPFDPFEKLNNPILHDRDEGGASDLWDRRSVEWDRCVDSVEDELVSASSQKGRS
jgi:hypothetical protein